MIEEPATQDDTSRSAAVVYPGAVLGSAFGNDPGPASSAHLWRWLVSVPNALCVVQKLAPRSVSGYRDG